MSLSVSAGESVAIVGESGAGKSTIVSLIPRFYEAQKGCITFDGHDIMYGKPKATEEEMMEAARYANIYDFVITLPDGFDTYAGERGVKLSGGQKQNHHYHCTPSLYGTPCRQDICS